MAENNGDNKRKEMDIDDDERSSGEDLQKKNEDSPSEEHIEGNYY